MATLPLPLWFRRVVVTSDLVKKVLITTSKVVLFFCFFLFLDTLFLIFLFVFMVAGTGEIFVSYFIARSFIMFGFSDLSPELTYIPQSDGSKIAVLIEKPSNPTVSFSSLDLD